MGYGVSAVADGAPSLDSAVGHTPPEVADGPLAVQSGDGSGPPQDAAAGDVLAHDGPPVDGGAADTGRLTGCAAHPDALTCDDFEGPLFGDASEVSSGGRLELSTLRARSGRQALRARTEGGTEITRARVWRSLAFSEGARFMRAYVWIEPGFTVGGYLVLLSLALDRNIGAANKISVDVHRNENWQLAVTAGGWFGSTPAMSLTRQRWVCVELGVQAGLAGGQGHAELFVDGLSVLRSPVGTRTLPQGGPTFTEVGLGVVNASNVTGAPEVFIDDLVISRARVGCEEP